MLVLAIARKTGGSDWQPVAAFADQTTIESVLNAIDQAQNKGLASGQDGEVVVGFVWRDSEKSRLLGAVTDAGLVRVALEALQAQEPLRNLLEGGRR